MTDDDLPEPPPRPRRWPLPLALAVLVLGGSTFFLLANRAEARANADRALTDTQTTAEVVGDVGNTLGRIFSYTPTDTAATAKAAGELLDGTAATQYQALFAQVQQQVKDQKLTLTTRVVRAGVTELVGEQAKLLVFLDQTAQREGKTANTTAAQLSVTARRTGGHWRITELTAR
ncbi:hypothetical protein ACGFX4_15690 [Kitasatospora sp. NPDC048365]|uniref:hypothetical protein n=1 Tax=Kitasatospora sp. NPDC048365 TaxID=3364050 RepID=UPI003711F549